MNQTFHRVVTLLCIVICGMSIMLSYDHAKNDASQSSFEDSIKMFDQERTICAKNKTSKVSWMDYESRKEYYVYCKDIHFNTIEFSSTTVPLFNE